MLEETLPARWGWRKILDLFWQFFKIGSCTFGGGWSIVAQLQKEFVEKRGELTAEELLDITSVGRSLPGMMIGNASYLFGYHLAGFPGALACLLGISLPPLFILTAVTWCYTLIRDNVYVARAMVGVRSAVVPIIFAGALGMRKAAFPFRPCYGIFLLGFVLYFFCHVSCVLIVLCGGVLGLALCSRREQKGAGHGLF